MPKTILLIEDDPMIAMAIRTRLSVSGFEVTIASDGIEGLAAVESERPDAIILDFRLPGIDGLEVCRRLKNQPATRAVPVIFLSANLTDDVRQEAIEAGVCDVLAKPYEAEQLLAALHNATSLSLVASPTEEKDL